MKRGITENFVWCGGKNVIQKILFDDFDVFDISFGEIGAEFFGGGVIWLDSDDAVHTMSEGASNNARASTDFYHGVAFFKIGMTN